MVLEWRERSQLEISSLEPKISLTTVLETDGLGTLEK